MAATDQLGTQGNPLTQSAQATLVGSTQAGDKVTLLNTHQATVANTAGAFQFGNVALQEGVNNLAVQITDAAGNTSQFALSVTRIAASATGNAAIQWNQVILNAIETDASTPEYASRALAIESIAVMNAVNALNGTPGYLYNLTAPADANANAAVAQAAHDVLAWLYPAQASTFDAVLASTLSAIPNGQAKTDGISLGSASAAKIIALRANDGYNTNIVDTGGTGVGIWQPTGPGFAPAQDPQWANLQTFALNSPNQFTSTLPGPPSLTSQAYADALNQTESLGAANSTTRTADQTQIAKFWSDGQGTYTPPGAWNAIADQAAESQGYSLAATAQLLGELNIAMADSAIAAWNVKYTDNTWRPITAIQNAHSIGNSAITQNSSWQPLLITPNFPEYVSGHSTFSAAAAEVLTSFFGANYAFSTTSSSLPGVTRSYTSFWDAANEAGMSRIYGGIHFSFSNTDGLTLGTEVGEYVLKVFSQTQDTTPPKIEINQPSGFATNANPTITGTVTDNLSGVAALGYTLDGGKAIAVSFNNDGSFQLPLNLALDGSADGQHTLVFTATDATGNATAPFTFNFTLATQKPAISLDGNSIQNNGALAAGAQISGTVTDKAAITGLSYQFDNGTVMPIAFSAGGTTNTASFSQALNLSTLGTGSHTLTLTVTDAAGNSSTQTLNLTQPALALPTITSLTPMNGDTDVGVTQRPHIQFSRAIDPSTLTASTFYATDSTGAVIPATLVMQQDNLGAWLFFTNPLPGASTVTLHVLGSQIKALSDGTLLDAAGTGTAGTDYTETFTTVSTAAVPNTTLSGIIVDPGPDNTPMTPDDVKAGANGLSDYANDTWKLPIAGVKVYILGLESQAVTTNAQGQFTLTNVPTGDVKVVIDGTTATNAPSGFYFPTMTMDTTIKAGIANTMMGSMGTTQQQANANDPAVYLPRVNTSVLQTVNNNDTTVIKTLPVAASYLTPDQQQVLQVTVTPGSLIGHDGQAVQSAQIGISTVPVSLIESMLPAGLTGVKAAMTLQAPGVEKFSTPLTATFPNIYNSAPGSQVNFFSYDHATGKLVLDGTATVSADGKTVTTDPGSGIKFPGWFFVAPPGGTPQVPVNQPTKPNCDLTQIFFDGVSLSSAGASLALSAGELAAGIIAPEIVLPFVISKVVLDGTSTGLSVVSTIHQWNSNSFDENARNLVDLANGVLGQLPGWGIPSGILGFSKAFDDLYNDYKKCLTNQNTSMSQAMNSVSSMQAPQFQYTAALDFFNQFLNQQATATTELSNAINQVFGSAIQQFVPTTSQNVTLSMDSSSFVFLDSNGKTIQKSDGTGDFTVSIADLVNAVNQNDPNVKTGLLNMSVALQDMGNAYKSLSSGQQYFANIQSDYANFISMEQAGSIPSPIKLGAETRYAIFDAQTGNAVYRGLLNNNQLGTFLGANTLYTVEVYDPTSNSYGFSTLQTGVSGSSGYLLNGVANGSIQMFVNNGSTPVLTDGLTAFAANVIGVDGTKADNLVPGMTDLAALQAGLLGKSQIASLTGVVSSVSLQGNAQAIALEGNSNNIAEQTALVATSQGLSIVDVSNYQSPTVLGQIQLSGTGNDVAVDSTLGLATVAMGSGGLAIVDVSKPQQPTLTQTVAINASHVQIKDGIAYASVGTSIDAIDLATGQILQTICYDLRYIRIIKGVLSCNK